MKRRLTIVAAAVLAMALLVGAVGIGAASTRQKEAGRQAAAPTLRQGKTVSHVVAVTSVDATTTSSTTFVNLPGASTVIGVPSGESGLLLIRFSAESQCAGGTAGNWCSVRVLVDGTEAQPASGLDFAFDSVESGSNLWTASAMDRSIVVVTGNHTVVVQWAVTSAATTFRLDDWSLTVERVQV